jgi:hypothetical protein
MNKLKLILLFAFTFLSSHAFAQYISPAPNNPNSGLPKVYVAPAAIKFANGARVEIYRNKIVLVEPDGHQWTKWRPLPDRARNPNGCGWLWHYLNTTSPYTQDWGDNCLVYLEWCRKVH